MSRTTRNTPGNETDPSPFSVTDNIPDRSPGSSTPETDLDPLDLKKVAKESGLPFRSKPYKRVLMGL